MTIRKRGEMNGRMFAFLLFPSPLFFFTKSPFVCFHFLHSACFFFSFHSLLSQYYLGFSLAFQKKGREKGMKCFCLALTLFWTYLLHYRIVLGFCFSLSLTFSLCGCLLVSALECSCWKGNQWPWRKKEVKALDWLMRLAGFAVSYRN